jgi:hypothetical protein
MRLCKEHVNIPELAEVALNCQYVASQASRRLIERLTAPPKNDHLCAISIELTRGGETDPAVTASDDRDLVLQLH